MMLDEIINELTEPQQLRLLDCLREADIMLQFGHSLSEARSRLRQGRQGTSGSEFAAYSVFIRLDTLSRFLDTLFIEWENTNDPRSNLDPVQAARIPASEFHSGD